MDTSIRDDSPQLVSSRIEVDKTCWCGDENRFLLPIYFVNYLVYQGYEYFCFPFHDLEQRLGGVVEDGLQRANVAMLGIYDFETRHFMVIELVASQFG